MEVKKINFEVAVYQSADELNEADKALLLAARKATELAYAPYSNFFVGAVALMANGESVSGTNQENASYPVGICAERVLLSVAATRYPGVGIDALAISYHNKNGESNHPVSPCGICRQTLAEYEERTHQSIRVILGGMSGEVYMLQKAGELLPLGFMSGDLKK